MDSERTLIEPCVTEVSGLPNLCANDGKDKASCEGIKLAKAEDIFGKFVGKIQYQTLNFGVQTCQGKECIVEARTSQDEYMSNGTCVQKSGDKAECKWTSFILERHLNRLENGTAEE